MPQFNIVLGESTEFVKKLEQDPGFKVIMKGMGRWKLLRTDGAGLFWVLDEEVNNLTHQFMIFNHPQIYLCINYHQTDPLNSVIKHYFDIAERDLKNHSDRKYQVVGSNYRDLKSQKKTKKLILEWCIQQEERLGNDKCNYTDLEDLNDN